MINLWKTVDSRIKLIIDNSHSGLGGARNIGIQQSDGLLISFVDSDDIIDPKMIEKMVNGLFINMGDIVICDFVIESKGEKIGQWVSPKNKTVIGNKEALCSLLSDRITSHPWNKLYKKECFLGVKYPEKVTYEDIDAAPFIFLNAKRIVFVHDALYHYSKNENGISLSYSNLTSYFEFLAFYHRYFFSINYANSVTETCLKLALGFSVRACAYLYGSNVSAKEASKKEIRNFILCNYDLAKKHCFSKKSRFMLFFLKHSVFLFFIISRFVFLKHKKKELRLYTNYFYGA
jgi:glycosyltransferase involved in cell wall biosynthesis